MYVYRINYLGAIMYAEADAPLDDADIRLFRSCADAAKRKYKNPNINGVVKAAMAAFNKQSGKAMRIAGRPWLKTIDI